MTPVSDEATRQHDLEAIRICRDRAEQAERRLAEAKAAGERLAATARVFNYEAHSPKRNYRAYSESREALLRALANWQALPSSEPEKPDA